MAVIPDQAEVFRINLVRGRELARWLQFAVWLGIALLVVAPILARMLHYGVVEHWPDVMSDGVAYSALFGLTVSSMPFAVQLGHTRWHQCLANQCGFGVLAYTGTFVFALAVAAVVAGGSLVGIAWSDSFLRDISYPSHLGLISTCSLPVAAIYCGLLNWFWVKAPFDPFTEAVPTVHAAPGPAGAAAETGSPTSFPRPALSLADEVREGIVDLLSDGPPDQRAGPPEPDVKEGGVESEPEVR